MGRNITKKHINEVMDAELSTRQSIPAIEEAKKLLAIHNEQIYIENDVFTAKPEMLLGNVIEVRKVDGECPRQIRTLDDNVGFSVIPFRDFIIDPESKLKQPVKRQSILVNQKLSLSLGFLKYLSTELSHNSVFNVMVFDQTSGMIKTTDKSWVDSLKQWKSENATLLSDPTICFLMVVTGFIQKNVIRRKYKEFEIGGKAGGYGVNIDGKLHTSSEDWALDIRFGLNIGVIHRAESIRAVRGESEDDDLKLTKDEIKLISDISKINIPDQLKSQMSL